MRILVVNLLRLGDIILSTPAIEALRARYPFSQIDLLINKQFLSLAPLLPGLNRVYTLDRERLQAGLSSIDCPVFDPLDRVNKLVNELSRQKYDLLVNLTQNRMSGYLCSTIEAKEKVGLIFNQLGVAQFESPWIKYLNEVAQERGKDIFHYADIFKYSVSDDSSASRINLVETEQGKTGAKDILGKYPNPILIQPFTSDPKKNWGIENYFSLVEVLDQFHPGSKFILLGAEAERERLLELANQLQAREISVCIETGGLEVCYSLIKGARLLITGDTSIKHMAAATNTKIIELVLGSSDLFRTGSYQNGAILLSPKVNCSPCVHSLPCQMASHVCARALDPNHVASFAADVLQTGGMNTRVLANEYEDDLRVHRARFSDSGYWLADTVLSVEHQLSQRIEKSVWKLHLNGESKKPVGEYGSEARSIADAIAGLADSKQLPGIKKQLDGIENESEKVEVMIGKLQMMIRELVQNYANPQGDSKSYVLLSQEASELSRHEGLEPIVDAISIWQKNWNTQDRGAGFRVIRKLQNEIREVNERNNLKLKLSRSVRGEL